MAFAKVGQVTGGEVTAINRLKGTARIELDCGEFAVLPRGRSKDFGLLTEGMELRLLVINTHEPFGRQPTHVVSEYLDDVVEVDVEGEAPAPTEPDKALVVKFPVGRKVKGKVAHVTGDAVIVLLDGVRARLPVSELNGTKVTSLRKDVCVSASVLRVDGTGVVLSRKAIA